MSKKESLRPRDEEEKKIFEAMDEAALDIFGTSPEADLDRIERIIHRWKKVLVDDTGVISGNATLKILLRSALISSQIPGTVNVTQELAKDVVNRVGWTGLLEDKGPEQGGGRGR